MTSPFDEMIELAGKLGIKIRHAHLGGSGGGLAMLRGQRQLFIDLDADPADQLEVLAGALAKQDLESLFIRPDVRDLIERYRQP